MSVKQNEIVEGQEDTQHGRFLTFTLDEEDYGIEIRFVTEIIGMQSISKIPELPEYIKGIINLRGKIIPVLDVRLKFRKEAAEYTDRTCIIVIDTGEQSVGLIVDNVSEVMSINDDDIAPPPDIRSGIQNKYIQGVGKVDGKVKLLLDCKKLFDEDGTQQTSEIGEMTS
jgi:purine-binding chemotaxis protein CheW